jgi:hypothetical protein
MTSISVIHPARNENLEIEATVASMLAAGAGEVIVMDDGSDIPLPKLPGTVQVRHHRPQGPSVCRNQGARIAAGDVLVFADAHTRIADLHTLAEEAVRRQCIIVPAMQSLYGSGNVTGWSRNFITKGSSQELLGFDMANAKPKTRFTHCGGNWGGFFIMPRTVYDRIGGWVDHTYWGYNDPSLILKAWFCDVPVILDSEVIYKHKGKVKTGFGYPVKAEQPLINLLHTYTVLFDPATVQRHWLPLMQQHHRWMIPRAEAWAQSPTVHAERKAFQSLKRQPDAAFFEVFLPRKGFNGEEVLSA